MTRIVVKINGLEEYENIIRDAPKKIQEATEKAISTTALNVEREAKLAAPVFDGELRQGILIEDKNANGKIERVVAARARHAPFVEFGTRGKVVVPAGLERYAAQFKGQKYGTWQDMLRSIQEWVRKKGLAGTYSIKTRKRTGAKNMRDLEDIELAYIIARAILKKGISPQPFLFPAYFKERGKLVERIVKNLKL